MTKTLKLATAAAGLALLVASPAYAFLGGVPGPNGAYTDQRTDSCCVSDGHKSQMPGLVGHGPNKKKNPQKDSGGGKNGGKSGGKSGNSAPANMGGGGDN